jgi:hypothetical protein
MRISNIVVFVLFRYLLIIELKDSKGWHHSQFFQSFGGNAERVFSQINDSQRCRFTNEKNPIIETVIIQSVIL